MVITFGLPVREDGLQWELSIFILEQLRDVKEEAGRRTLKLL